MIVPFICTAHTCTLVIMVFICTVIHATLQYNFIIINSTDLSSATCSKGHHVNNSADLSSAQIIWGTMYSVMMFQIISMSMMSLYLTSHFHRYDATKVTMYNVSCPDGYLTYFKLLSMDFEPDS